jgi:hypothetical protein
MRMTTVVRGVAPGGDPTDVEDGAADRSGDDPRARSARWRARRPDPLVWGPAGLALLVALGFVLVNTAYNQGRFSPPLDDVYIHLQYARQIGLGHFLEYQTGQPPSTGASSLLYVLVLGAASALGAPDGLLLYVAVGSGVLCTVATTVLVAHLGRAVASRWVGAAAAVFTALCGPFLWGATSGMEVGLVAALAAATVLAFALEQPTGRFRVTPVVGVLLVLTRPEGLVLVSALLVGVTVTLVRACRRRTLPIVTAAVTATWCALPLVAALGQRLLYRALTGSSENNGVLAKSWLYQPLGSPIEVADRMATSAREAVATYGGLGDVGIVAPGTLLLAAVGLAALALDRPRHRVLAGALALGLLGIVVADSTLMTALWQNGRYMTPFLPLVMLLVVLGTRTLGRAVPRAEQRHAVVAGLVGVVVLVAAVSVPTWALRSAQQGAGIREAALSPALWLRGNTPPGARIGVNDVGATAYFSDRTVVDLIGLTTNGLAIPSVEGTGALYEALARMPADQRPTYFSVFPDFVDVDFEAMSAAGVLSKKPLTTFETHSPVRDEALGGVCQANGGCKETDVWTTDWSVVGSGDRPEAPVPGRVVDAVNVGDLADEAAHGYGVDRALVGMKAPTILRGKDAPGGRRVVDSGREVVGGEHFTMRGLTPGRPVTLTTRVEAREPLVDRNTQAGVVAVGVDGRPAGDWKFPTDATSWVQASVVLPGDLITASEVTVTLGPRQPYLQPYPDYRSFHYWASQ